MLCFVHLYDLFLLGLRTSNIVWKFLFCCDFFFFFVLFLFLFFCFCFFSSFYSGNKHKVTNALPIRRPL